jgi:hypothetical protein
MAMEPKFVHLLYTPATKSNFQMTKEFLEGLKWRPRVEGRMLDLQDPTDYEQLKERIPEELREVRRQHRGQQFYLISGLAQPRLIFALCLASGVLDGTLLEVPGRPDPTDPWPADPAGYRARVREVNLGIFAYFRELTLEIHGRVRLRIGLDEKRAWEPVSEMSSIEGRRSPWGREAGGIGDGGSRGWR